MCGGAGHHRGEEFSIYTYRKPCGFVSRDAQDPGSVCRAVFLRSHEPQTRGCCWTGAVRPLGKSKVDKKQTFKSGGPDLQRAGGSQLSSGLFHRRGLCSTHQGDPP